MIENPCNKCEWYRSLRDECHCGEFIDDECYGRVWKLKYEGYLEQQRKQCQGKDFVPRKSLWRRFIDWIKGGSE